MDVLAHYISYKTYYRLLKACEDDPNVERKKAARALTRFLRLHPHNMAQKTEVMGEHFQHHTRHRIGGHAKAMVVTGSRLEAVRYKQSFDRYIGEKGYPIKSLVDFSGTVEDDQTPEKTYTEVEMNGGIREKALPEICARPDYRVLLVAEKYQTGFDQPLLHTMYVDKRIAGIQAVQTLSRLNRIHPLKEDTFVLDFVNNPDEIREAFRQYYEGSVMGEEVDPDRLYVVKGELDGSGIYLRQEVDAFAAVFFAPKRRQSPSDHKDMNAILDRAVARFRDLQEREADQLFFDQLTAAAVSDDALRRAAEASPADKFQLVFRQALESLFIERMDLNEALFTSYMSNPELQDVVSKRLGEQVYKRFSDTSGKPDSSAIS